MPAALALGGERVVEALAKAAAKRGIALDLMRTGSRGLLWLEPLLEIETQDGWRAFGPLAPQDVDAVLDGTSAKALGDIEDHPWLKRQTRLIFARCGTIDPAVPPSFDALKRAREIGPGGGIGRGDEVRPARPRRRGFSGRHQVEGLRRRAGAREIRRLQRRRGRQRHLRRPQC